ncbi:MAG: ROK family protein [Coriobacteriales bacterium]|nr:ROK family protein [Coriobacteriales bacterium]
MDRAALRQEFLDWAQSQTLEGASCTRNGDKIAFTAPWATAHCDVYALQMDVVSLDIMDPDGEENRFFLHFELNDLERAQALFGEMRERFVELAQEKPLKVLLSCTSALTTSFFAKKLNDVAKTLNLKYEFSAVAVGRVFREGFDKDVVLLAPQAAFEYDRLSVFLDDRVVRVIPAKLFGAYDAAGVLDFMRQAIAEDRKRDERINAARLMRQVRSETRVLVLSILPEANQARIACRLYQQGKVQGSQTILKKHLNLLDDVADILATAPLWAQSDFDVVGIACSDIVDNGVVTNAYSLESVELSGPLEQRFGKPVVATNGVNAAALGYYLSQDRYEDILLASMPLGHVMAGQGIVLDGKLRLGAHHAAGETAFLMRRIVPQEQWNAHDVFDPDKALELVSYAIQSALTTMDPQVVCVHSDMVPDTQAIREVLARYSPERYIPELEHVSTAQMQDYMLLGQMSIALKLYESRTSAHE